MDVKIGQQIEHGGENFIVVDIVHQQKTSGKVLVVVAYDPDTADEADAMRIKAEEANRNAIDIIRNTMRDNRGGF